MSSGKILIKVLKYTRTASAKLKIFQKISTKNKKFNNFILKYTIHKNSRRSLRNPITQVAREQIIYHAMATKQKTKASDYT